MDKTTKRLEIRNAALQANQDALDRWLRKLLRAATAIEKLRVERKRLLKPRSLEPIESLRLDSTEWHDIHNRDFGDDVINLFNGGE